MARGPPCEVRVLVPPHGDRCVALPRATRNSRADNSLLLIAGWGSPRTYLLTPIARHEERGERVPERRSIAIVLSDSAR